MIFLDLKTAVFAAARELIRTQSLPILSTPLIYSYVTLLEARTGHSIIMRFGDGEMEEFLMRRTSLLNGGDTCWTKWIGTYTRRRN